jgi:hypothetical protein
MDVQLDVELDDPQKRTVPVSLNTLVVDQTLSLRLGVFDIL